MAKKGNERQKAINFLEQDFKLILLILRLLPMFKRDLKREMGEIKRSKKAGAKTKKGRHHQSENNGISEGADRNWFFAEVVKIL